MARRKTDKLAQDVHQAIAAGMSYGRWKAMQPIVTVKQDTENYTICPHCGKRFKKRNGKKFCGDDCRSAAYYDKQKELNRKYSQNYRNKKKGLEQ